MPRTLAQIQPRLARPSLGQRLYRIFRDAANRRRDRVLLARLDDHLLRDIGLTPDEAGTECAKPFWRS